MRKFPIVLLIILLVSCTNKTTSLKNEKDPVVSKTSIILLGTIQDAGYPQIGCKKKCCAPIFDNKTAPREVVSLGLIDVPNNSTYLFEATPDIVRQIEL